MSRLRSSPASAAVQRERLGQGQERAEVLPDERGRIDRAVVQRLARGELDLQTRVEEEDGGVGQAVDQRAVAALAAGERALGEQLLRDVAAGGVDGAVGVDRAQAPRDPVQRAVLGAPAGRQRRARGVARGAGRRGHRGVLLGRHEVEDRSPEELVGPPTHAPGPRAVDAVDPPVVVDGGEHVAREVEEARALLLLPALVGDVARDTERPDRPAAGVAKRALGDRQHVAALAEAADDLVADRLLAVEHLVVARGDVLGDLGQQLGVRAPDDLRTRAADELRHRAVDDEVAALEILDVDRVRRRLEHLLEQAPAARRALGRVPDAERGTAARPSARRSSRSPRPTSP